MEIPELSLRERMDSFISLKLDSLFEDKEKIEFTKDGLAKFCLQEIDSAIEKIESIDKEEVEEGLQEKVE